MDSHQAESPEQKLVQSGGSARIAPIQIVQQMFRPLQSTGTLILAMCGLSPDSPRMEQCGVMGPFWRQPRPEVVPIPNRSEAACLLDQFNFWQDSQG